ncbi:MAG: LysM peptidoglycan-binding domain-containing protein [Opitutaceae bacterium]|nr:LysM peptidoglycan-binding domain-containing protein [Cytophagales bacterium]
MKTFYFLLITLLLCLNSKASPLDSIGITKQDGKFYIKYLVEPGETVYRISTKYGIPVSDLLEENPELEKGLKTGMVLLIPYLPEKKPKANTDEETGQQYHTVEKGETFFSLSKKYNISVSDLLKQNNVELKTGQKILINKPVAQNSVQKQPELDNKKLEFNTTKSEIPKKEEPKSPEVPKPVEEPIALNKTEVTAPQSATSSSENYSPDYVNSTKKVIVIPFDPYLYFSDADDEIAAVSKINRVKVRQAFRKRLNAYLEPKGFETIHLLGGQVKDSTTDLNRAYSSISYTYDNVMMSGLHIDKPEIQKSKGDLKKPSKGTELNPNGAQLQSRSSIAKDDGKYFAVRIKDPNFFPFFNTKYKPDYYIFVSQFEVKTNYENCLDRARQNYERVFTTHFSIFDKYGKQVSGGRLKSLYESGNNHLEKILSDNIPALAEKIMAELPK